jgi:hypothetical protein
MGRLGSGAGRFARGAFKIVENYLIKSIRFAARKDRAAIPCCFIYPQSKVKVWDALFAD